ncbi:MAG: hypothetical protein WAK93_11730 [Solirubrobacteraceae bacterium]
MAKRFLSFLAIGVAAAAIGGCGGSSKSSSSASSSAATSSVPSGFSLYRGDGFSVGVPSNYQAHQANLPGLPAGAWDRALTANGQADQSTNAEILAMVNPNLQQSIDQVTSQLRQSESADSSLSNFHTSVRSTTVPGAQQARIVTESYISRYSNATQAKTEIDRTWLMVSPKPGTLIDVVVVNEPKRGGDLNPSEIINSFHLTK